MRFMRQTKFSGNGFWSNLVYQNYENPSVDLTVNNYTPTPVNVQAGSAQLLKVVAPRDYSGGYDFVMYGDTLTSQSVSTNNFKLYAADGITEIAMPSANASSGNDGHDYWYLYTGNITFLAGQTYYLSVVPPLTQSVQFIVLED